MDITAITLGIALISATTWQPARQVQAPARPVVRQLAKDVNILPTEVAAILERAELQNATIGLFAINLESGKPLLRVNANRACMPASNQKLLTAVISLGRQRYPKTARRCTSPLMATRS
jgi:D-alanyl-D-alanine carboxypeptidase